MKSKNDVDWLEKLIRLVQKLIKLNNDSNRVENRSKSLPIKIIFHDIEKEQKEQKLLLKEQKLLPAADHSAMESGLDNFKPDDLSDNEIAHTYSLIEEIKKTLKTQEKNKFKERKKHEKKKKERLEVTKQRAKDLQYYFETLQEKPRHHMLCFIMYDIENNRIRTKVAKYLEEKGLKRVQKSVFFGDIDKRIYKQVHEVLLEIQASYENSDSLMLVPVSEDEVKSMKLIGKEVSFEYAIIRQNTLFF